MRKTTRSPGRFNIGQPRPVSVFSRWINFSTTNVRLLDSYSDGGGGRAAATTSLSSDSADSNPGDKVRITHFLTPQILCMCDDASPSSSVGKYRIVTGLDTFVA